MAKGFILLRDALAIMASHDQQGEFIPFSLTYVTLDLKKATGGRRLSYDNVVMAGAPFGKKHSAKDPRHFMNSTRNVMLPGKPRPHTIHNVLITEFNGERVVI